MNISLRARDRVLAVRAYFLSSTFAAERLQLAQLEATREFDALIERSRSRPTRQQIAADTREAHELIVDDAPWMFIVHDRNPRAMTKKVKGFTSAQSWFQDFTPVEIQ